MPQFDFYSWSALSFWTIVSFQVIYFFLLYYVISLFSELQKVVIKLSFLFNDKKLTFNLLDTFGNFYLTKPFKVSSDK